MNYNTIIIGGGHNGLICAAVLAKAGQRVLVVEAREALGGAAVLSHDAGLLAPEVIDSLGLALEWIEPDTAVFAPQPDGRALTLHTDLDHSVASIAQFSEQDAKQFPKFVNHVQALTTALKPYINQPTAPAAMASILLDKPELLRVGTLPAAEWLRQWFESDALLGLLGSVSITHLAQGPYSQGTGFMFLYHMLTAGAGGYKRVRYARGGMDNLIAALAEKATSQGVEIQTSTAVQQILLDNGRATGIQLTDGTTITAERVISTTTPKQTMFGMVGAPNLPPSIVRRVKNGIYRGITAKLNLSLRELPAFNGQTAAEQLHGHIVISPSLDYLERAFDATKYGRIAEKPYLDMVLRKAHDGSGAYTLAMTMQYAPYHLRGTDWASQRDTLSKIILGTLEEYATGIRDLITGQTLWTPLDLEEQFGLTEGSVTHGQMELGQMFALRPVLSGSGPSQRPFETVIPNLYIAGSGAHPGGGFTGRPGLMAAQVLLAEA